MNSTTELQASPRERVAILGAGSLGSRLGSLLRAAGHDVVYGAPEGHQRPALHDPSGVVTDPASAIRGRTIVIVATPFQDPEGGVTVALVRSLAAAGLLDDVILVDATNPVDAGWAPVPLAGAGAELVAAAAPRARTVKAFNTVFADLMTPNGLVFDEARVTAFVAGDDEEARARVLALGASAGFAPIDAGRLANARWLESMAHLNIALAVTLGGGTQAGFCYVRRGPDRARAT